MTTPRASRQRRADHLRAHGCRHTPCPVAFGLEIDALVAALAAQPPPDGWRGQRRRDEAMNAARRLLADLVADESMARSDAKRRATG